MFKIRAFTLIELLIVVAIIAILAAIAVPNFLEAQSRAKVSAAKSDIRAMVTGLEAYRVDNTQYPGDFEHFTGYLVARNSPDKVWDYSRTLQRITTPIAYLTELPSSTPFGPASSAHWLEIHGYMYQGGDWWWRAINEGNYKAYYNEQYWDAKYLLSCMGPAKSFGTFIPYDPTNGTISLGDIIYVGGNSASYHSFN
ncbi:MAG TPA: prepilin-type N-terminal cleavage/methylation domain-containing protein [Candidatus Sumerlaeota bacterium]|nr:prepilin-type N-terminal cleavage/methylation domain-containing protein [Candidatus Sumerlaeota bacterium]